MYWTEKKEYCILNKQYSKEEYLELLPKIKQHMEEKPYVDNNGYKYSYGEFFPSELSPFTYNESLAMMYSPLSEEEILEKKYRFHPYEKRNYTITLDSVSLPNTVSEYDKGDLTKEIIGCEHAGSCKDNCTTAFRVLEQEVALYKSLSIPLSILCPNCRNMKRLNNRGPFKLWKRSCMCNNINHDHGNDRCKEVFQTSYSSERPEIVYCEMCYKKEIA